MSEAQLFRKPKVSPGCYHRTLPMLTKDILLVTGLKLPMLTPSMPSTMSYWKWNLRAGHKGIEVSAVQGQREKEQDAPALRRTQSR